MATLRAAGAAAIAASPTTESESLLPKFTWSPDPDALGFVLPTQFLWVMLGVAVLAGLFAWVSHRAGDRGGVVFGIASAIAAVIAGLYWPEWQPWIHVRYYSLLFVVVFLGGYWLLDWQIRRGGGAPEVAGDFIVYGVIGVLAGARLGHVIFYDLDKALADPLWVFQIWTGGLASHGAVIGLVLSMWLFTQRRGVSFLEGADRFAFAAALGATLVRVGNFLNSEIVGREIKDGSWGVLFAKTCEAQPEAVGCWKLLGARAADFAARCQTGRVECWGYDETVTYRHPSQLYEVGLGLLVLGALWLFDRALGKEKRPRGALISLFFALYFVGRFIVEFFKEYQTPATMEAEFLTEGQWLSIPGILLGCFGLYWTLKQRLPAGWAPAAGPPLDDDDDDDAPVRRRDRDVEAEFGGQRRRKKTKKGQRRRAGRTTAERASAGPTAASAEKDRSADDADATAEAKATEARAEDAGETGTAEPAGSRRGRRRKRARSTTSDPNEED